MLSIEDIKKNVSDLIKWTPSDQIPEFCRKPVYLTLTGSRVSGLDIEDSDVDVIGVCIPSEKYYDPYKHGYISEFDNIPKFQQWEKHGYRINDREYDVTIYSLPRYFRLCLDGNINIVETLFTEKQYHLVHKKCAREFLTLRQDFLSMNCYYKFKGFANAHKKRLENKRGRQDYVAKYGFDTKEAAFLIRAYEQCLRLLKTQNIVCKLIPNTILSIKQGKISYDQILKLAYLLESECEREKNNTDLRDRPDTSQIRKLLLKYL